MTFTQTRRTLSTLTFLLIGLAGCDGGLPWSWNDAVDLAKKGAPAGGAAGDGPSGGVTKAPPPATKPAPPSDKPTPPAGGDTGVSCQATKPADGVECKVCADASGAVVYKECYDIAPPSDTPATGTAASCTGVTDEKTGQVCKQCVDAAGAIVFTDCGGGATGPSDPNPVKCADVASDDPAYQSCTVCWDATGTEIKRACLPAADGTETPPPADKQ